MTEIAEDVGEIRELDELLIIQAPEDSITPELSELTNNDGRKILIDPPVKLTPGDTYRIQVWKDGTVSVWHLVFHGEKETIQ